MRNETYIHFSLKENNQNSPFYSHWNSIFLLLVCFCFRNKDLIEMFLYMFHIGKILLGPKADLGYKCSFISQFEGFSASHKWQSTRYIMKDSPNGTITRLCFLCSGSDHRVPVPHQFGFCISHLFGWASKRDIPRVSWSLCSHFLSHPQHTQAEDGFWQIQFFICTSTTHLPYN